VKCLSRFLLVLVALLSVAAPAQAVIVLDFENIAPYPNGNNVQILNFYNGGTSSIGTSGPNFGIAFGTNALLICLNTLGTNCSNTSRGGLGDPSSQLGSLFFLDNTQTFLNLADGFTTGFSFNYTAINQPGSVSVFDGLNGTGNVLASLNLPTTPSGPCPGFNAGFCPFVPTGIAFAGTAQSIAFAGVGNQIVFDDITFGSVIPGGPGGKVPEPTSMLLFGVGLVGLGVLRRRKQGA